MQVKYKYISDHFLPPASNLFGFRREGDGAAC